MITLQPFSLQLKTAPITVEFCFTLLNQDILIIISGPNPHAGAVSLADPYKKILQDNSTSISVSTSTLSKFHHRDSDFTSILSKEVAKEFNKTTIVVGGIHIDNISGETINEILTIPETLIKKIRKII